VAEKSNLAIVNIILIKILATALAFSQATTRPEDIKTYFDPAKDKSEIAALLNAGCAHMRRSFDLESIDLDGLLATAMDDADAIKDEISALRGLSIHELHATYRQFCRAESVVGSGADLGQVASFYNQALSGLPEVQNLKGMVLQQMSVILDRKGQPFAEIHKDNHRRVSIPLADIPSIVRDAFIAVEDKRFMHHGGFDERGLVRAFVANLAQPGRPQGGSTITQQVAKNFLVGNDVTYERKIQEIVAAARIERMFSKQDILEIYLNGIYLGRGAWGVEMAARAYFGKSVSALSVEEAGLLAGLAKGPNYFSPDRYPDRALARYSYAAAQMNAERLPISKRDTLPPLVPYERIRRETGFNFTDFVTKEARTVGFPSLETNAYLIRSTIDVELQRATEAILQEGLFRYERSMGRATFAAPEANLAANIKGDDWVTALLGLRMPLYDVHWKPAVVLDPRSPVKVGLSDGSVTTLSAQSYGRQSLKRHDVIYIHQGSGGRTAELRTRPFVQGAILVLENRTGRILSMAGAFSYPVSQLDRTTQSVRQPGSTFKPLTYLAALQDGLQPYTLVSDTNVTLPPVGQQHSARASDYWSPRNADGGSLGPISLRRALENSRNQATAQLMAKGFGDSAEQGLDRVCALAIAGLLYKQCTRHYPFILGAQPLRLIDLAAFYAAIANEGLRPSPHAIESIDIKGRRVYSAAHEPVMVADPIPTAQLKAMLQGVLANGTGRAFRHLAPYAAGKTGTTDDEVDAWFVGFTNEVTIAIWVGYDNAGGKRRTLGRGQTGGRVALPLFEPMLEVVWQCCAPKSPLSGPSPEAAQELVALDDGSGHVDYIRRGFEGTRSALVSATEEFEVEPSRASRARREVRSSPSIFGAAPDRTFGDWRPPQAPSRFRSFRENHAPLPRKIDPDYFFGTRPN
jgi:penicillin-binding protein 1A